MQSPLISCIIPAYNGERYLGEALDSIVGQTYRPLEIIVANDGSSDGTASLIANYKHEIRFFFSPTPVRRRVQPGTERRGGIHRLFGP
jgi:glycosyltransferase involved in cell wall biosynthesis